MLEKQYEKMVTDRRPYLERAQKCAKYTIPSLFPEDDHSSTSYLVTPYNSVGARGVNTLSSSFLMSLFPPQDQPFFRLILDEKAMAELEGIGEIQAEIDSSLARMERVVMKEMEVANFRPVLAEAIKHLVVGGNVLLHLTDEGNLRMFGLNNYVVKRDGEGNVLKIITKESIAPSALPEELRAVAQAEHTSEEDIDIYTCMYREGKKVYMHQEMLGRVVPNSEGEYPLEKSPYLPLRMFAVDGMDYARSIVDENFGDLKALEKLQKALVEGAVASARVLFLVAPNGTTRAKTLAEAPNGAIREGRDTDVTCLQMNKFADFRVAQESIQQIQERLSHAFLLTQDMVRQAERVTAEEIRMLQQEIQKQYSSIYSQLGASLQLPLVKMMMSSLQKRGKMPKLPQQYITAMIITGVDALGRGQDLNKLEALVAGIAQTFGPQAVSEYINIDDYLRRKADALGIKSEGLIVTEQDRMAKQQQQQQQAMMAQMAQQATAPIAQEGAKAMMNPQSQGEGPPQ